ncbi:transmembrane protein 200C-like isoform X2 [Takifugu rubripes]|uniref:transmembrane protein 200C-like isoform X2 n=1 Tax=Takifugu rubripes TaxID=31033 RepID=UPI0011453E8F|nr:transmembrane protein 200C-like isoform X2 [Takifugu rubripes]
MIATGGLLRITARRQDSLPKTRKAHKSKKSKQKRTEVVVVKGKLKLISVSGLVASLGFLVLLVGMVMAALGYWPRDGPFFKTPAHEGAAADSAGSTAETAGPQKREAASQPEEGGGRSHGGVNGTGQQHHSGFLKDLLYRYLHSDRLKVWGPLIMGVGIFLFICGNAVLHENRDKKTKVINLRDIYSTVIDLQRGHKPSSPSAGPLNGLVNYVQSKSLESKSRHCPPFLMNRGEGGGGGGPGSSKGGAAGVTSIYRPPAPAPPPSALDLSPGPSSLCWTSMFTFPPCPTRSPAPWRRPSAREGVVWGGDTNGRAGKEGDVDGSGGGGAHMEEVTFCPSPPRCSSALRPSGTSCSFSSLHLEAPGGSRALLLSSPFAPPGSSPTPDRRCSLPIITCCHHNSCEMQSSHHMTSHL